MVRYLCALFVVLRFDVALFLKKRLSSPSPPLFSARDTAVTIRADINTAALGLAFAFGFGYRIGRAIATNFVRLRIIRREMLFRSPWNVLVEGIK